MCVHAKPDDADVSHNSLGSICQLDFHFGGGFRGVNNDIKGLLLTVCVCVCVCVYVFMCGRRILHTFWGYLEM